MHNCRSLEPFRRVAALLAFMAGAAHPAQAVQLPPADQILDKFVKAIGGKTAWDSLTTETRKGLYVRKGYKRGLDIGTARGYSSMWLGLAMRKTGGRLITIEVDPETAD